MRRRVLWSGRWRVEAAALAGLACVALCLSTFSGSQAITLCISSDGHLDLKHATGSCHSCPDSTCPRDAAPAEPRAAAESGRDTCCFDIPLMVDLVGWFAPRGPEQGHDDARLAAAGQIHAHVAAGVAEPCPGGPCTLPGLVRKSSALTALACVVLLL